MKPAHLAHMEAVILLEDMPDGPRFRTAMADTRHHVDTIVERERDPINGEVLGERLWFWQFEERALTGQRIFREMPRPVEKELGEDPMFDEMVVKKPLPFTFPPGYKPPAQD